MVSNPVHNVIIILFLLLITVNILVEWSKAATCGGWTEYNFMVRLSSLLLGWSWHLGCNQPVFFLLSKWHGFSSLSVSSLGLFWSNHRSSGLLSWLINQFSAKGIQAICAWSEVISRHEWRWVQLFAGLVVRIQPFVNPQTHRRKAEVGKGWRKMEHWGLSTGHMTVWIGEF